MLCFSVYRNSFYAEIGSISDAENVLLIPTVAMYLLWAATATVDYRDILVDEKEVTRAVDRAPTHYLEKGTFLYGREEEIVKTHIIAGSDFVARHKNARCRVHFLHLWDVCLLCLLRLKNGCKEDLRILRR